MSDLQLAPLSEADSTRLQHWKWLYWLQADGWTRDQAQHLLFQRLWFWDTADRTAQVTP